MLPIIAGAAAAWLLQAQVSGQQQGPQPGWPCTGTIDSAYVRMAEATGGVVMLFKPSELTGAAAQMTASSRHDEVVFRGGAQVAQATHVLDVPIDSSIESVYFFVSMQCLQSVAVVGPTGEEIKTDAPGVEHHAFEAIRLLTVPAPAPGLWRVKVTGRGFMSLIVKAKSDLTLANVVLGDGGAPRKSGSGPQRLEATMRGSASEIGFELVSVAGARIRRLDMALERETDDERTYAADITPPSEFRVAMIGRDPRGFRFQRVEERLNVIEP